MKYLVSLFFTFLPVLVFAAPNCEQIDKEMMNARSRLIRAELSCRLETKSCLKVVERLRKEFHTAAQKSSKLCPLEWPPKKR
jgi:hypothetical protein